MKKWVSLLALVLCLNGTLALASEVDQPEIVASEPAAAAEAPAEVTPPEEGTGENAAPPQAEAPAPVGDSTAPVVEVLPAGNEAAPAAPVENAPAESTPVENAPAADAGTTSNNVEAPQEAAPVEPGAPSAETPAGEGNPPAEDVQKAAETQPADTAGTGENAQLTDAVQPADATQPADAAQPADQGTQEAGTAPGEGAENPEGAAAETPATPEVNPEAAPAEVPAEAEARFETLSGTLEALLGQIEGKGTVLLRVDLEKRVFLENAPLKKLSELTFEPDSEVFVGDFAAYIATDDPKAVEKPALVNPADFAERGPEETAPLYFWVDAKDKYAEKEPEPEPEPAEVIPALGVAAEKLVNGAWSNEMPVFTLSGIPEGMKWIYAAIVYDQRIVPLSGNTFTPDAEGQYSVRFAMLDGIGDVISASETYDLWLDATEPETVKIENDAAVSYTMHVTARDGLSGVTGISLDGGATWAELADDMPFTYTGQAAATFSPGSIQVRDAAGNLWRNATEHHLEAVMPEYNGGGGGGGGGGSGEKKAAPSHASGDGDEGAKYEALALDLPQEPMTRLTVGGETLPMTLVLDAAQGENAPVGEEQPFTASLANWQPPTASEDVHENVLADAAKAAPNTLVLAAVPEANLGSQFTYAWTFNGEVYRLLSNSGVKYVALKVGDDLAAFPTEGFTGGTKYTELKMLGVSTRKFDYTLTMRVNLDPGYVSAMSDSDFSQTCDLSIRAEVENMAYELSGSTNSLMYFYDVYLGPEDMLGQPFGEYKSAG